MFSFPADSPHSHTLKSEEFQVLSN